MRIHILGIGGTFMAGVALLAKENGHEVSGSDEKLYPPMSLQLQESGIPIFEGYEPSHIPTNVDCVVVGNVIKRGNPAIEYVLNQSITYQSGPDWLYQHILKNRFVLAVAGTHGKTTTSSLLAWVLTEAGLNPGFLIGGIPQNYNRSAQLGDHPFFVIEADEYDSAFFDKRSKFIHYHPKTLILNNLEFDHADIFPDLNAIKHQFHHLVRTIPGYGHIILNSDDENLKNVIEMGCWSNITTFGKAGEWSFDPITKDGSRFDIFYQDKLMGRVNWQLIGEHNIKNALAVVAATHHLNVDSEKVIAGLSTFKNVKKRMEVKACINNVWIYDDFAHHPTAIKTTLSALRARVGDKARVIAVVEFGSYTMRNGFHKNDIHTAFADADMVVCKNTDNNWGLDKVLTNFNQPTQLYNDVEALVSGLASALEAGDHVLVMSNSNFDGIHQKLIDAIANLDTGG